MKKVLIRVDGGNRIGMGHVMRCITLAKELRNYKIHVYFVCANENSKSIIKENNFEVIFLKKNKNDMNCELSEIVEIVDKTKAELLIVDSYLATDDYYINLKKYIKVVVIDGKSQCAAEVAAIINPNVDVTKELYYARGIEHTKLLCGITYSFVRREFIKKRRENMNKTVDNILLTIGGSDFYNVILKILKEIKQISYFENIKIHVVIGPYFEKETISQLKEIADFSENIYIYEGILDLSDLMSQMDLIITAGGTTVFEAMALAIPCVVFAIACNQYDAKGLNKYINWFGDIRSKNLKAIDHYKCKKMLKYIEKIVREYKKQQIKIDYIKKDFDGKGVEKIASTIITEVLK